MSAAALVRRLILGAYVFSKGAVPVKAVVLLYGAHLCFWAAGEFSLQRRRGFFSFLFFNSFSPLIARMTQDTKKDIRVNARNIRRDIHKKNGRDYSEKIKDMFLETQHFMPQTVFAGYYPIGSEVNSRPLMDALNLKGHATALPHIVAKDVPLVFRLYRAGDELIKGSFGVPEPHPHMPNLIPDVLIIPMLAFNKEGYRLGYGTGFYDRTLEDLRRTKPVKAIGVAYSHQQNDSLPLESHDEKMDWIITEKEAIKFT